MYVLVKKPLGCWGGAGRWEGDTGAEKPVVGPELGWWGMWELRGCGGQESSWVVVVVVVLAGRGPSRRRRSQWAAVSSWEERRTRAWPCILRAAAPSPLPGIALLEPATEILPQTQVPEFIDVTLKVSGISPSYRHSVSVPAGSSLEDVLKNAQEHGRFR